MIRPRSIVAVLLWIAFIPGSTDAYTISSILTPGCHEDLTSEVLRTVRLDVPGAAPLPLTADEQALVDDVQFIPADDMRDLGGVTLLVSVRDNDLKGRSSDDLTELAEVHGNPDNQDEHCLRNRTQDEPGGSEAAVNDCRRFIRGRVAEALEGLDANGIPDPAVRTALPLHLSLRGDIDALLPTFYVRMGQAIHGVEDSFTHTYRTADGMQITAVMNWVDKADGTFDEARDGPAHATRMDACDDSDALDHDASNARHGGVDGAPARGARSPQDKGGKDGHRGWSPRHVRELRPGMHLRERLVQRAGEPSTRTRGRRSSGARPGEAVCWGWPADSSPSG